MQALAPASVAAFGPAGTADGDNPQLAALAVGGNPVTPWYSQWYATQSFAELKAGTKMPEHKHPQEQIIHILSGRMKVFANGGTHELGAGDSYYLASNVPHGVETPEVTRVLDTFSPPRDEYIALDAQAAAR